MKKFLILLIIFGFGVTLAQKPTFDPIMPLEDYNFVLGTNNIGGKYQFTDSKLIEQSKHILGMGSNILKISLGKKSPESYGIDNVDAKTTLELFKAIPEYKMTFNMNFKYIFAWVHTLTDVKWKLKIDKSDEKKLYDEMYEFAEYLLKEYNNTGKIFMIGNWEGDWLLHSGFNRDMTPPKLHVKNMTKWFQIRQKAIDDAKKKVKHNNVEIYHYIELNLVLKGMAGKTSIASEVLPNVNVDFISYSSYESIKNKRYIEKKIILREIFDYLEGQLKPKVNLPFERRVFIGEYGYQANRKYPKSLKKQFEETKEIMQISLELNLPFALHWQMYNNEYDKKTGRSKEMSLISEAGKKRKLYYLHQNYYKKLNRYLKKYKAEYSVYPSSTEFNKQAIKVLKSI
jgi:hypothetical protein